MLEDKEQNRDASRKAEVGQSSRKTMDISDSGLYY